MLCLSIRQASYVLGDSWPLYQVNNNDLKQLKLVIRNTVPAVTHNMLQKSYTRRQTSNVVCILVPPAVHTLKSAEVGGSQKELLKVFLSIDAHWTSV